MIPVKQFLFFILLLAAAAVNAQSVRTDTVKPGYYIPFDSNYVSCKVAITPAGQKTQFTNSQGNKLADSLVEKIGQLKSGSVVLYTEVTIMEKGVVKKSNTVRYVIGHRNSVFALRDPSLPDTLPAAEIAEIVLDQHVYSFTVSYAANGNYYTFDHTGNGLSEQAKTAIRALPSGTRVWFENIRRKEDDGRSTVAPPVIHVVR